MTVSCPACGQPAQVEPLLTLVQDRGVLTIIVPALPPEEERDP